MGGENKWRQIKKNEKNERKKMEAKRERMEPRREISWEIRRSPEKKKKRCAEERGEIWEGEEKERDEREEEEREWDKEKGGHR